MTRLLWNALAGDPAPQPPSADRAGGDPRSLHARLPGYAATEVRDLPAVAQRLGLGRVRAKLETGRFGLPAFKLLGASWAVYRELCRRLGGEPAWATVGELGERAAALGPVTLVTATDGNHGRAVARMAALLGFEALIIVPEGISPVRVAAIRAEGAAVRPVDGSYDEAVLAAAGEAGPDRWVISDTSWPGYEDVPRWVIEGYGTIFSELDDQQAAPPDVALVQIGVGALAAAVAQHARRRWPATRLVGVEPLDAACLLESVAHGEPTLVAGPHRSVMAGLNCGLPSMVAWPPVRDGLHAFLAIPDERAVEAMELLAGAGVEAGETGAAGLGGLVELLEGPSGDEARERLALGPESSVLVLVTEGRTG